MLFGSFMVTGQWVGWAADFEGVGVVSGFESEADCCYECVGALDELACSAGEAFFLFWFGMLVVVSTRILGASPLGISLHGAHMPRCHMVVV